MDKTGPTGSIHQNLGIDLTSLAIHVDGLRYQPSHMPATEPPTEEPASREGHGGAHEAPPAKKTGSKRRRKAE